MQRSGPTARILVVEDDPMTRRLMTFILTEGGYTVAAADGAASASRILEREEVHLILLDVGMPHVDGLDFCRKLRGLRYAVPIVFVTGRPQIDDKVAGFDAGADDYITKPFEPRELLVRVRALLSRQLWGMSIGSHTNLRAGGLELNLSELTVKLTDSREARLTPTEMRVLQCLMMNAGRVVTRDHLLSEAWGYDYESNSNQVEVYMRRLRRKVDVHPEVSCIETVRGLGYRLLTAKQAARRADEAAAVSA